MASSNGSYFSRPNHRYLNLTTDTTNNDSDSLFEFDESDIYNNSLRSNTVRTHHHHRSLGNKVSYRSSSAVSGGGRVGAPASVPVNIPDWSKILGNEYGEKQQQRWRNSNNNNTEECCEEEGGGDWDCCVPPHEFLARTRVASLSVHEGAGRTLKGRDLSRVRNAIWAKTGFSD